MINNARQALRQGRFGEASHLLEQIEPDSPDKPLAHLWQIRVLAEQGMMAKACVAAEQNLQNAILVQSDTVRLWSQFIILLAKSQAATEEDWESFDRDCSYVLQNKAPTELEWAVAKDLSNRSMLLRIALYQARATIRPQVAHCMIEAAHAYIRAGDALEAQSTLLRGADIYRGTPFADRVAARSIYQDVSRQAQQHGDSLCQAEADLLIAELDLEDYLQSPPDTRTPELNQLYLGAFDSAGARLEAAGHNFGEAKAGWKCARLLLLFGIKEGVEMAHQIVDALCVLDEMVLRQEVWKQLATWHTYRGEWTEANIAQQHNEQLSQRMQFGLAREVDTLVAADTAFRSGQLTSARNLLEQMLENTQSRALRHAYRFSLSVAASAGGLDEEAKNLLHQILNDLESIGPNFVSAQAYLQLANLCGDKNFAEALGYLDSGCSMYEALGDNSGQGQVLAHKAWLRVQHRRKGGEYPAISPEAEIDFNNAQQFLSGNFTLEGQIHLATLCQYRGQAAFFDANWQVCGHYFDISEEIFRRAELRPQLAFTLFHQALVGIELGRERGVHLYESSKTWLKEAQQLFEECHLWSQMWQVWFYQGICDMEGARWEKARSQEQKNRWERAAQCFHMADWFITELRGFVGSGIERQHHPIVFNIDKQLLYNQAFQLAWWERQEAAEAFSWLERMKSRVFLDTLAATTFPAVNIGDDPLVQQEQALHKQKHQTNDATKALSIQREIDTLLDEMALQNSTTGYAALRRSKPATWPELRTVLRREQHEAQGHRLIVAEFFCDSRQSLLFVMCADWESPQVAQLNVNLASLQQFVNFDFKGGLRMMLEDRGEEPWQQFKGLIAPLETWSRPGDIICLIPHGIVHDLPLHTLRLGSEALIERNPVFYSPSASVLQHTLDRSRRDGGKGNREPIVVFGDSRLDLSQSRAEAETIARYFGVRARLGGEVTREAFLTALKQCYFLHFAGHGEASASSGFESGLCLAGEDFLRALDLVGFSSHAKLVTLSGCETGLNQHQSGDELIGLVRAFLSTGVGSLLVSQWPVNDASTQTLLTAFYDALSRGLSKAESLQMAIRAVRAGAPEASFYHWGGFTLVGDWK